MTDTAVRVTESTSPRVVRNRWIMLGLIVLTLACYARVGKFDFLNYDDPKYITTNADVADGFTAAAFKSSFTSTAGGYRHPITWWSHLLDISLFGVGPGSAGGHHATSLVIHTINAVLLFWVLSRLTGAAWPSAWVAAMFAIHPTHVESVAWVAERKDVLSGLFFLLTIWAYQVYTERRDAGRYALVVLAFAAALMSKPMMVTLPGVLLLLDIWPLRRIKLGAGFGSSIAKPLIEKLPLFAMSIAVGLLTIADTQAKSTLATLERFPLGFRFQTAIVSYARYLGKLVWPTNLSVFYPYPADAWQVSWVIGAAVLFVAITGVVIWQARKRVYLLVGWLWFVGTLLPVIGLLITGDMSLADRYTYTPFIGLFIALAWLARDLSHKANAEKALGVVGAILVAVCAAVAFVNVGHWRNSLTLMGHSLAVTENNWVANTNYASALRSAGRKDEARPYTEAALKLKPDSQALNINYARDLIEHGDTQAAVKYINAASTVNRDDPDLQVLIGQWLAARGQHAEAIPYFQAALAKRPRMADALFNCATSQITVGRIDDAEAGLKKAIAIDPTLAMAYHRLGKIAERKNKPTEAAAYYAMAIDIDPKFALAHLDYGILLANTGRYDKALPELGLALQSLADDDFLKRSQIESAVAKLYEKGGDPMSAAEHYVAAIKYANQGIAAQPDEPVAQFQLAIALKDAGRDADARAQANKTLEMSRKANNLAMINALRSAFGIGATTVTTTAPTTAPATRP